MSEHGHARRASVDPAFTFGISLLLSLLLWWSTFRALLAGNVDITVAGLRYLVALGLAWCGTYLIATLVAGYSAQHHPHPHPTGPPTGQPMRRRDDIADAEVTGASDSTAA